MRQRLGLIALIPVIVFAGACTSDEGSDDLEQHQARWETQDFDAYTMTLALTNPVRGTRTLDVLVRDGRVQHASLDMKRAKIRDDGTVDGLPSTVEDLFAVVGDNDDAESLIVEWDQTFGYPTSIAVDASDAIDDEFTIEVRELIPLETTA